MLRILSGFIFFLLTQQEAYSQHVTGSIDWPPSDFTYVGAENRLSCTVEGIACKSVILTTDNGSLTKDRCNYYTFKPDHLADSKIIVSKKVGKKSRKIGEFFVRVRSIPDPVAIVGGLYGGSILKGALRAQTGIGASLPSYLSINVKYPVRSYSITAIRNKELLFLEAALAMSLTRIYAISLTNCKRMI